MIQYYYWIKLKIIWELMMKHYIHVWIVNQFYLMFLILYLIFNLRWELLNIDKILIQYSWEFKVISMNVLVILLDKMIGYNQYYLIIKMGI